MEPQGIVVDVRCIRLDVRWLYPNQLLALRSQGFPPTDILGIDEISSGEVVRYDRSRQPRLSGTPATSYGPDTSLGQFVRFKDLAGAAIKYGPPPTQFSTNSMVSLGSYDSTNSAQYFHRIPRAATQGFDMNVQQVTSISTKVLVRWQDWSITEEESVNLYSYLNEDEHDVWPGERVSLISEEGPTGEGTAGSIRLRKVGVVQNVNALARTAQVRWYHNPQVEVDDERQWQSHGSTFGELGEETTEVPLFDIAAHAALTLNRGDMAIVLPAAASAPAVNPTRVSTWLRLPNILNASDSTAEIQGNIDQNSTLINAEPESVEESGVTWFGEMIDVCLDGTVTVRLGAADEVRDIPVAAERILAFSSEMADDDSDFYDSTDSDGYMSDEMSVTDTDGEAETDEEDDKESAAVVSVEYEGGQKFGSDEDEDMWSTDEEEDKPNHTASHTPAPSAQSNTRPIPSPTTTSTGDSHVPDSGVSFADCSNVPLSFSVLESSAPSDHHFYNRQRPLTAGLMRRIGKENKILRDSLPDGVFVRSWESRLDLLRILIVGPYRTPYEFAPFVVDLHYSASYPEAPPDVFFHSWTGNMGRINPNLYEDGKICLSLLGTWNSKNKNEAWSSDKSTILQLVVSLMGLVLVKEPYFSKC